MVSGPDGGVSAAYHIPSGVRLTGKLDVAALGHRALDRIIARHEALRTVFVQMDGEPELRIAPMEGSSFHLIECDLSGQADTENELQRLAEQEALTPFDLAVGPLARGRAGAVVQQ